MQLEHYISDLLYRYECVTVPNFGAFLSQRVSATVHETTNAFYPPKKSLAFNEQIQTNDGLLARYIADVEDVSFERATEKIANQVKSLKSYLIEGEVVAFENIGDLKLNNEGKIVFSPSYHLNYLTDAFGLSQLVSPPVTREVYKETVEAIEKVIPITVTAEKRKAIPYLKYAAAAIIALTIGGFGVSNYHINNIATQNEMAQEEANAQLDTKIQEATFIISNPLPTVTLKVTKQTGNYHIVAGAFRVEANSDKKVEQLQAQGFKARKIGMNRYGLHQVAYATYENRFEALRVLNEIRESSNEDAWLLVKQLP
ncbi:SPOR domain-containing protein [Lacinutrix neustonica]|uniref:SPOR domain-containing protein n=1 Tax=Lacinutrix neustonica TaxID=2980107 RepID=A0A9E8MUZ4_9FLAO|nr:SPOR domain-containing protein [Lacinutrix neustonica]WAC01122.1 SPOR domain-containing protein [Lacinutrix neustonica]